MKVNSAATLAAILLPAIALLPGCGGASHTLEISRDSVHESLKGSFPLTYRAPQKKPRVEIVLSDPETLMEAGEDFMGLRMKIIARKVEGGSGPPLPGPPPLTSEPLEGGITVHGDLEYDQETASFFYRNCFITELHFQGLPGPLLTPIRNGATAALKLYLDRTPVYKLEGDDTQMQAARMLIKSVAVKDGKLLVELGL